MNWLSNLLRKPTAKPAPAPVSHPIAPPKPVIDTQALRLTLVAATTDEERLRAAAELGRGLAGTAQAPRADDPPEVWTSAIGHCADRALALGWLSTLQGDSWLGEIAARGRYAETRLAAAQRIVDSAVLERVAHDSRDKDKRVYRHCSETLKQRQQAGEHARLAAELSTALHALLSTMPLPLSGLLPLEKSVRALAAAGASTGDCDALLEQARSRLQQEAAARRDLQSRQHDAAGLLAECGDCAATDADTLAGWRARLGQLEQARAELPAWLAASATAFDTAIHDSAASLARLSTDAERRLACEAFLAECDAAAAASAATAAAELGSKAAEVDATAVDLGAPDAGPVATSPAKSGLPDADARAAWAALAKPEHGPTRQALEARWQALCKPAVVSRAAPADAVVAAAPPAKAKPAPVKIDEVAVRGFLDQLEEQLGQGHLAGAEGVVKQIDAAIAGGHLQGTLDARLQRAHAQLGELRGWARWSTVQARERLVAAAEALLAGERSVDDLAVEIPALREEWKKLNAHGPSARGQWESFDAALEKAYAPVTARRAEDAVRQGEARAVREALCAEWEAWLAGIVWSHADYQVIEARRQEILNQWRDAPHAGFRDERVLRKRLDALIADLDVRLDAERSAEIARREAIIAAAEALAESTDATRATSEAKALQERWRVQAGPLRLKRGDEQKLWQRFRAACDTVFAHRDAEFARRDAQRAELAAQREERRQARQALLDNFATTVENADTGALKAELSHFRSEWSALRSGPRETADGLETRAQELQQRAQQRLDVLRRQKFQARYDLLARKAEIAAGLETAALAGTADEAAARAAWAQLPRLPGAAEAQLGERLAAASTATAERLADGIATRDALLLDLEIVLGLPSPGSCGEQRRTRQLERLQDRFGTGTAAASEAESLVTRWYATAASADAGQSARLAAAVSQLVDLGLAAHV